MSVIDELKAMGFQNVYYGDGEYDPEKLYLIIEQNNGENFHFSACVENNKLCEVQFTFINLENFTSVEQIKKLIEALKGE